MSNGIDDWLEAAYEDRFEPDTENLDDEEDDDETKQDRCADCGEWGEITGHMECQYPKDRP